MNFYIDMMPREIYKAEDSKNYDSRNLEASSNSGIIKSKNNGLYCYPLCDLKFKNGDITR